MARVNIDRELEDEGFHPCLNCGEEEFSMDWTVGLYSCLSCGESIENTPVKKEKVRLTNKKPSKDNWE